jgi:hypothetical protein
MHRRFWEPIIEGSITKIPVYSGEVALIDTEDLCKVRNYAWYLNHGYVRAKIDGKYKDIQRVIMDYPVGLVVDHRDHNKLDNRKINLRICTNGQNQINQLNVRGGNTGVKGVHFCKNTNRFMVTIGSKGHKYLGSFETLEEATAVREAAEDKYHGEFKYTPE